MRAVEITMEPDLVIGETDRLWEKPYLSQEDLWANYDVAPDGRFLMLKESDASVEATRIHVFLGWLSRIEERMEASE